MLASAVISKTKTDLKHALSQCFGSSADVFAESKQNQMPMLLLAFLGLLCILLFLYTFRSFDDNRLISWYWSFSQDQLLAMLAQLSIALAVLLVVVKTQWRIRENIVFLSIAAFILTIPFWQTPEVIIDNARYFTQAKYLELYGVGYFFEEWGGNIFAWTDLPLIPFIYGVVFQVFGEHRVVIQILGSLFFTCTVALTYLLGKVLWSRDHGMIAATLLLGIPYLYSQIPLMMVDIPTMFFLTLAMFSTVVAIKEGGDGFIVTAAVAIVLALFTKYSAWIFLSVIPLAVFILPQSAWRLCVLRFCKIAVLAAILWFIALSWYYPVLLEQINILLNYQWGALDGWQESYVSTFLFHIHPLISVAALISMIIAIKRGDKKFLIVSSMLILVVLLNIQRIRYLLVVFPMLALMAGYALTQLPNLQLRRFLVSGIVLVSYITALSLSAGFLQNTSLNNLKNAGAYLNTLDVDRVEVLVLPQQRSVVNPIISVPTLDYHTHKTLIYIDGNHIVNSSAQFDISKSSVRFTWEYPMPDYYQNVKITRLPQKALAIIYSDKEQIATDAVQSKLLNYRLIKQFQTTSRVFKFKTLVNLYVPA
ncbi:ArnT family glycosyltransferase [Kaarinaea lacus]